MKRELFPNDAAPRSGKPATGKNGLISSIWTFPPEDDVSYAAHSIYRWYGTLPGPLVGRLLDLYGGGADAVIDPMCGVGTTLVEARLRGLSAEGWDVNPLACLITQTKLEPVPAAVASTLKALHGIEESLNTRFHDTSAFADDSFDYARKWFSEASLERLLRVACATAETIADDRIARLLLVALAGCVREVAEVDARCTHHLVRKRKPYVDVLPLLQRRALGIAEQLAALPLPEDGAYGVVRQADVMAQELPTNALSLLHPPYLGVIHYHLIHRLSTEVLRFVQIVASPNVLDALNFDPVSLKASDVSTDRDDAYAGFTEGLTQKVAAATAPDGRVVVILGDARHKGHLRHPFTEFIFLMERAGLALEDLFIWILQNNGGMHVLRRGHHIDHNYILVFHRK
jgi:hypothetical protein